jgi:hypothetical protein
MCGCTKGMKKNINLIQQRNQIITRKNNKNNPHNKKNKNKINLLNSKNNMLHQKKIIAGLNINFPFTLLNKNKDYPFLVNRRSW